LAQNQVDVTVGNRLPSNFARIHANEEYHARMRAKPAVPPVPPASPPDSRDTPVESERDQISQNIEAVLEFYTRENQKISRSQRILERISNFIGQPVFLGFILLFVALLMLANDALRQFGMAEFDPAPFFWLQGIVGLGALLTATVVLTKQNRLAKLAEQRAHLDLKVTLLTEQKAAKLIDLLEELRRDLPNVKNRHDPEAAALQQSMNPDLVLAALDERSEPDEQMNPAEEAKEDAHGNE
jgi:uncharacterized membrane protein